jgi:hypothetical protein
MTDEEQKNQPEVPQTEEESLAELLNLFAQAPEGVMDATVKARIAALPALEATLRRVKTLELIDDCVYAALCADVVCMLLSILYEKFGGTRLTMEEDRKHEAYNSLSKQAGY